MKRTLQIGQPALHFLTTTIYQQLNIANSDPVAPCYSVAKTRRRWNIVQRHQPDANGNGMEERGKAPLGAHSKICWC